MASSVSGLQLDFLLDEQLKEKVSHWLAIDQAEWSRNVLIEAIKAAKRDDIKKWFSGPIEFGTAGLRAPMGPGTSQMNDVTVIQASQGLCRYLLSLHSKPFSVMIGYDGRHHSKHFANLTALAFVKEGVQVHLTSNLCPTPYTAFGVTSFGCVAGVMVTASHNPKEDNGYKVYWQNGAQIISPHDKHISSHIAQNSTPWEGAWDVSRLESNPLVSDPLGHIIAEYNKEATKNSYLERCKFSSTPLPVTYTAMHGVGYKYVCLALDTYKLPAPIPVPQQVQPDPEFPTVKYPNPEEGEGVLNLAMATADAHGSPLILANDPDADRLAVAVKHGGVWRPLNGNEIGTLLGWWAWYCYQATHHDYDKSKIYMVASAVSSKMLQTIAEHEGFQFRETLTGFKWMGNLSCDLRAAGNEVLFSFEEAIGFCFGNTVLDKDGVNAVCVMTELAFHMNSLGKSLVDLLDDLYAKYGYHGSYNSYYICHVKETIDKIFAAMRKDSHYPSELAGQKVVSVRDLTVGYDSSTPDKKALFPKQSGQMITFYLANNVMFTLRTSGTEPKIKFYSEIRAPSKNSEEQAKVHALLKSVVDEAVAALLRPHENGLLPKA